MFVASKKFNSLYAQLIQIVYEAVVDDHFVVFDVDSTLLIRSEDNTVVPVEVGMDVHSLVTVRNIPIYYVTARVDTPFNRHVTISDLQSVGIYDADAKLFMRPDSVSDSWAELSQFKANMRQTLEAQHERQCLLNVGDQWSDLLRLNTNLFTIFTSTYYNHYVLMNPNTPFHSMWALKIP